MPTDRDALELLRLCSQGKEQEAVEALGAWGAQRRELVANSAAAGWPLLLTALRNGCQRLPEALVRPRALENRNCRNCR